MRSIFVAAARLLAAGIGIAAVVVMAAPASAHTDFDFSLPTDGASVGEPVSEVTVAFTLPVTLVGNGFEVLDPQENVLQPFAVTDDNTVFRLQFDPPLAGGTVGVRYTVTAQDGHTLSGGFSLTVSVDLPPPTTAAATLPPATVPEPEPVTSTTVDAPTETPVDGSITAGTTVSQAGVAVADVVTPPNGSDESDRSGVVIWIAAGVALLAAAFLAVRARPPGGA